MGLSLGKCPLPSHVKVCTVPRMQDVAPKRVEGRNREKTGGWSAGVGHYG